MIDVYCYVPSGAAPDVVECGLKLSEWYDREVIAGGELRKCISALLNPKDDMRKYRSAEYTCIKLELDSSSCYIADRCLYEAGRESAAAMELYEASVIPAGDYIFGTYRMPECLVAGTVIVGQISISGKWLDTPILYDNSEQLYINNIIETYREKYPDFNDTLLYYFYCGLEGAGTVERLEDGAGGLAFFKDKRSGRVVAVKIPEIPDY